MTILVTGAAGLVGSALLRAGDPAPNSGSMRAVLMAGRGPVRGLTRDELDITEPLAIAEVLDALRPEAVINAAAQAHVDLAEREPERTFAVNAVGPGHLARACSERGIRLVHLSTDYVLDGPDQPGLRLDEDIEPNPRSVYGFSKLAGEEAVLAEGGVVVRLQWVYHPGGRGFFTWAIERLARGESVRLVTDQVGCPTPADWLAPHLLACAKGGPTGLFHLATGGEATAWEWIEAGARALGLPLRAEVARRQDFQGAWRPPRSCLDSRRFAASWGVEVPQWEEALAHTLAAQPLPWSP